MKKKKIFVPYNFGIDFSINSKANKKKPKKSMIISPIPISINKKQYHSINFPKKQSLCNKIFFNFSLNKPKNTKLNIDNSISREKSKEEYSYEIKKQNDLNNLKKNIEVIKIEIDMINKMIKDNQNNIKKLTKTLDDINLIKKDKQKLLEDNLSKKETLEEMCKSIINNIKNNNYMNNNDNFSVEITLEEIKINNRDSFINQVFNVFNYINNYHDNKYFNFINFAINQAYLDLHSHLDDDKKYNNNKLIQNFFYNISFLISSQILCKVNDKDINLLLHFLLKINVISENISKEINFLEFELKDQKKDINNNIKNLENKIISLQGKKNELLDLKNKINEKIEIFSRKKTPFCEKTIYRKRINMKDTILNRISTPIHISTEYNNNNNKSNPNSIGKKINLFENNNKKENDNKMIDRKKYIYRNMMKYINKKSYTGDNSAFLSKKISEDKIYINGISENCSNGKNTKNRKKINLKDINKKIKMIGWTQKKDNTFINKNNQNGLNIDIIERKNINKKFKDLQNLTDFNNISNLNQANKSGTTKSKDFDNGKSINFLDKSNSNENEKYSTNICIKRKDTITDRYLEPENITQIKDNNKGNGKTCFNNYFKPIYQNQKYNLNNSFEKIKKPLSINIKNNFLNKYFTKKNDYIFINSNNNSNFQKIRKKSKNLINRKNNKNKALYEDMTNRKINKNSFNILDKSEMNLNNIFKENTYNNNSMESFCYYKIIENDSKLFDPLNNNINLNKLGYNEGFISIDTNLNSIKIDSNNILSNNSINFKNGFNSNYKNNLDNSNFSKTNISYINKLNIINIHLKEIKTVYLNRLMKNIVKIHNIFLKYNIYNNKDKDNSNKKILNINKLLNVREIMNIKDMEQSEKIKAGLCNFFSFIIELNNNNKIELILINYIQFNSWFNYLEEIANNNIKSQKCIANGNSSGFKNKNDENEIFRFKSLYSHLKRKQNEKFHRSITEKKNKDNLNQNY